MRDAVKNRKNFGVGIIHVGPHKTGSSAIQRSFDLNKSILSDWSIYYPDGQWHAQFGSCFCSQPENYIFNIQAGSGERRRISESDEIYLSKLTSALRSNSKEFLVISYEGFVSLDFSALSRMKEYLEEFCEELRVIFYCREPMSLACSEISQRLRSAIPDAFDVKIDPPTHDYIGISEKLRSVFGRENVFARKYERKSMLRGSVVFDFLDFLGVKEAQFDCLKISNDQDNPSLTMEAAFIAQRLIDYDRGISHSSFQDKYWRALDSIRGRKLRIDSDSASYILEYTKSNYDYIKVEYGVDLFPDLSFIGSMDLEGREETLDSVAAILKDISPEKFVPKMIQRSVQTPNLGLGKVSLREGAMVPAGGNLNFDIQVFLEKDIDNLEIGIHLIDSNGILAFGSNTTLLHQNIRNIKSGEKRILISLEAGLPAGRYTAGFSFVERTHNDALELGWIQEACAFEVVVDPLESYIGYSKCSATVDLREIGNIALQSPRGEIHVDDLHLMRRMNVERDIFLGVTVANFGNEIWKQDFFYQINLSYHWRSEDGIDLIYEGERSTLELDELCPGQTANAQMRINCPREDGAYRLELTLVQERLSWFENSGFESLRLKAYIENGCCRLDVG